MIYELQRGEIIGESLRRICGKQIEAAIEVARGERDRASSAIWRTRKHLKRARAVLRLGRRVLDDGSDFRALEKCLRDVGRLISEVRDAEVRLQTVSDLRSHSTRKSRYSEIEAMLTMELENFMAAFCEWQVEAVPTLENARAGISQAAFERLGSDAICLAIRQSYKEGRNALADAEQKQTAECSHRLRREVKTLCFHLRILRPTNPLVLKRLSSELGAVASLLGRAHDLSFLEKRLRAAKGDERCGAQVEEVLPCLQVAENDLQTAGVELAAHFYAEAADSFAERIAGHLQTWETQEHPSLAETLG